MKGLVKGWIPFGGFCRKYGIKVDGGQVRKLKLLDGEFKQNLSTENRRFWIVDEEEAKKRFKVKGDNKDERCD